MTPRRSTLLLATLAIWSVAWAVWTADVFVEAVPFPIERALRRLPLCLTGVALCMALASALSRLPPHRPLLRATMAAAGIGVCSLSFALLNEAVFYLVLPRWGPPALVHIPDVAMMDGWVFLAWTLLLYALAADAARRDRELALAHSEAAALDARHRLLVGQAQPHFLFNALNAIYALVLDDDAGAAQSAVLTLSQYLRRSLDAPDRIVTVEEELDLAREYLAIERLRFGDRLRVEEVIAQDVLCFELPSLIVQPLVENSVKHGLGESDRPLTIKIAAARIPGAICIRVEDDSRDAGCPDGPAIGLASIVSRLQARYGPAASLEAGARAGGGYTTRITIPVLS